MVNPTKKLSEVLNQNQVDTYTTEVDNLFNEIVQLSEDAAKKGYSGIYFTPNSNIRHFMSLSPIFLDFLSKKLLGENLTLFIIPTNSSLSDDTKIYITWVENQEYHKMNLIYCNFKGHTKPKSEDVIKWNFSWVEKLFKKSW
jgi:hypothetical protein